MSYGSALLIVKIPSKGIFLEQILTQSKRAKRAKFALTWTAEGGRGTVRWDAARAASIKG